jgi:hypothetical protein
MSRLSKTEEFFKTPCLFCGENQAIGGFWAGDSYVSVCSKCAREGALGALLGDALADELLSPGVFPPKNADYGILKSYLESALLTTERSFWKALTFALLLKNKEKEAGP